ncbi:NUDIX domain-containing protein [Streptomyces sp. NPDC001530]|uniref:NUDIX hydrolase n=1 Tax=Streptomyces sp. NPDC001530 TaxID=3364582 RepID=UPI003683B79C
MANSNGVPEKVAWILVRDDRVLVTRSHSKDRFYVPGGHREPGESDGETLVREIDEELQATIDPGSIVHFGTFEIGEGHPDHDPFRMICYTADHLGRRLRLRYSGSHRGRSRRRDCAIRVPGRAGNHGEQRGLTTGTIRAPTPLRRRSAQQPPPRSPSFPSSGLRPPDTRWPPDA